MLFRIKQDWKLQSSCNIVYTNNSLIKLVLCWISKTWDEYVRRDKQIHGYRKTMGLLSVCSIFALESWEKVEFIQIFWGWNRYISDISIEFFEVKEKRVSMWTPAVTWCKGKT